MNERALLKVWGVAASTLVIAATPAWLWGPRAVIGVLVGGVWNLASLWCLVHLLTAWLGPHPSRRRAIGWLLLKVALLALLVFGMLRRPGLSIAGFCVGLSVVLVVVVGHFALHAQRIVVDRSHGR